MYSLRIPLEFLQEPDYILSRTGVPTHNHLVCERSPFIFISRGFVADYPLLMPVEALTIHVEILTIPSIINTGPKLLS